MVTDRQKPKGTRKTWRTKELDYVRDRYQTEKAKTIAVELNRSVHTINHMVAFLGIKKNRRNSKLTGKEATDG